MKVKGDRHLFHRPKRCLSLFTHSLTTYAFCLLSFLSFTVSRTNAQGMLSGSEITQNDAVKNSKFIFVGKIEEIGPPLLEPVGEKSFHGVKITVITALQGAVAPQILVSIAARIDLKELSPRVNERYVFFANSTEAGGIEVVKLLPADDNTISSTSRLISP